MKQSDVLIRPYVTEKSMNHMSGTPTQTGSRRTESTPSSSSRTDTPRRMSDRGSESSEVSDYG